MQGWARGVDTAPHELQGQAVPLRPWSRYVEVSLPLCPGPPLGLVTPSSLAGPGLVPVGGDRLVSLRDGVRGLNWSCRASPTPQPALLPSHQDMRETGGCSLALVWSPARLDMALALEPPGTTLQPWQEEPVVCPLGLGCGGHGAWGALPTPGHCPGEHPGGGASADMAVVWAPGEMPLPG